MDDVMICQHETVWCKDDARSGARIAAVDIDDGGADAFDGADDRLRIGIEQIVVIDQRLEAHNLMLRKRIPDQDPPNG